MLPIIWFFTLGMHAGYAVYFPELYPTRLCGTGSGVCFNGARLLASTIDYVAGAAVLIFAPETRDQELPE
ncbi:MAG: hypothetical protein COA78_22220 [Blastopirellula sp.]|nr:MAG: hypothetical protein COA78_22220 [Blastopirellula sp.]